MLIRQEFRIESKIESKDEGFIFLASRDFKDGSYKWNDVTFLSFASSDIKIKGWAKKTDWKDKWHIVNPFIIEKGDLKIPITSDLDELCELAVTDFSTFEKKLCEIAGVQDIIRKDKLIIGSSYTFINGNIWIEASEYNNIKENETTIYDKRLRFDNIPIANWEKMNGYLIWIDKEQIWKVEKVDLYRKKELPQGTIREYCYIRNYYELEKFVQPIKNELISLFEAVKNVDFDAVKNLLKSLSNFAPSEEVNSTLTYTPKSGGFFVEIDRNNWFIHIGFEKKEGKNSEVVETLKKLIEKGDNNRLRAYCEKIVKFSG